MTAALPAKLKIPSIAPFATRAAQLQKIKPIIAYWCNYHIVNQILSKGLHAADDECRDYTTNLMDELETVKGQTPPVDAIIDDVAAKAYVEQFALETFQRADNAIHTDAASRQTIDTFQAASTFLELLSIWAPLEPETSAQIKYAKYHALRIAKAIKAGEDPNASNPKDEHAPVALADEPEEAAAPSTYVQPTVEEDVDVQDHTAPSSVMGDRAVPDSEPAAYTGDYFPPVPAPQSDAGPSPSFATPADGPTSPFAPPPDALQSPQDFYTQQPTQPPTLPVTSPLAQPPVVNAYNSTPQPVRQAIVPPPVVPITSSAPQAYLTDDDAVAFAQKHAKWAISALNFEDVPTAVKELRLALQALGAS